MSRIIIIGSGFSGLASACYLADAGHEVIVLEKNPTPGGRARKFEEKGFTFDMGPSWYWMPDVFESFFKDFNKSATDYYNLTELDPAFSIIYPGQETADIPKSHKELEALFESIEPGSSVQLRAFMEEAKKKYEISMKDLVYKPCHSPFEFVTVPIIKESLNLNLFQSYHSYVRKYFKNPKLISLMEFPVLFLGALPKNTPALYSLMNYAGLHLGTFYPDGGMHKIVEGMVSLAKELGVKIICNSEVTSLKFNNNTFLGAYCKHGFYSGDYLVSSADYHHTDTKLSGKKNKQYSEKYWDSRVMAPSSLIYYLGIDERVDRLKHHNLFFDTDFVKHAHQIYDDPKWPDDPLFYVCCPSKTDYTVAPPNKENLFILIPTATGITEDSQTSEKYYNMVMDRLEKYVGHSIRDKVVYRRDYSSKNFIEDYHSFKGNAYGLANTLSQTAFLKPRIKHKKIHNFYFTGQLTVPGPGVPPSLISGKIVAREIINQKSYSYESIV